MKFEFQEINEFIKEELKKEGNLTVQINALKKIDRDMDDAVDKLQKIRVIMIFILSTIHHLE